MAHAGNNFMNAKAREDNSTAGFTLDVGNNTDNSEDAHWLAVGK